MRSTRFTGLFQPPRGRDSTRARRPDRWHATAKEQLDARLVRLRREITRLGDEIRFELSRRRPAIERVMELRERERQRLEEVAALVAARRGPPPRAA
jgi:hypothetical protein